MSSNDSKRFGTFFDRVQVERSALRLVNIQTWKAPKLHGLTTAAIDAWIASAHAVDVNHFQQFEAIAKLLRRISARVDALADQSRTVFANDRFKTLPTIDLLQELQQVVTKYKFVGN
jgi:hypothetical protein